MFSGLIGGSRRVDVLLILWSDDDCRGDAFLAVKHVFTAQSMRIGQFLIMVCLQVSFFLSAGKGFGSVRLR